MSDYAVILWMGTVYVKPWADFVQAGGLTCDWGKSWHKVQATSEEAARQHGAVVFYG